MCRSSFLTTAYQLLGILFAGYLLASAATALQPWTIVGAVIGLGFLLLFLAHPAWGLLLVLLMRASTDVSIRYLTAVGARGEAIGGLLNIALILALTFAGGLYVLSRSIPMISLPGGRLLTLLLLTGLIGVARSDSFLFALNEWVPVLASFVVYVLAACLFPEPRQIQRVLDIIGVSFIPPAVFGLHQFVTGGGIDRLDFNRVFGTFVHPSVFGEFLVMIIAIFLAQALFQAGWRKVIVVVGLFVALLLLGSTYARMDWAGALVVLFVVGLMRARALLLLLPLGALTLISIVPSIGERLSDSLAAGGSLADRLYRLWPATLQAWLSATGADGGGFVIAVNRLVGLGPGVGGPALSRYGLEEIPHNDFLRVLVEYGVFGLTLYVALISVLAVMAYRTWRQFRERNRAAAAVALPFLALTLAFPLMSITDNVFAHTAPQLYFWTLAGLTVAVSKWERQDSESAPSPREQMTAERV